MPGLLNDKGAVDHKQRLLRNRGREPLRASRVRIRKIKGAEDARQVLAFYKTINGAASGEWLGRKVNRMSSDRQIDAAADSQQRIAHGFEIEAAPIHFPEKLIAGIERHSSRIVICALLVNARKNHQPVQLFQ